jgi:signal transduction histidine kinase
MLIGLSFSLNDYWSQDVVKDYSQEPLRMILLWDAIYWPTWAILAPLIFWVARRFPLGRKSWYPNLFITLAAGFVLTLLHRIVYLSIAVPIQKAMGQQEPFSFILLLYNLPLGFMSYSIILLIKRVADYAIGQKEEARASRSEAEASRLEAVLAQKELQLSRLKADLKLRPHFIFNALNSIASQLRKDANAADEMLAMLGDFLRLTLKYSDVQTVTLAKELEILRSYLAIEKVRLEDGLQVREEVEPQALASRVPTFILQPSVENAIKHRQSFDRVQIIISARREGGKLCLQVKDNGDQWQDDGGAHAEGTGIENTRARLESVYGSEYRFELTRAPDGWTSAAIEMPFAPPPAEGVSTAVSGI